MKDIDRWRAVVESNSSYDGKFFYGVKTTKIYCRPSCKSKAPLKVNVVYYIRSEDAIRDGFRPCKRCRPDLLEYDPDRIIVEDIKDFVRGNYIEDINLDGISKEIGSSRSNLSRIFKEREKISIMEYLGKVRIEASLRLLEDNKLQVIEVAYGVGFKSLSNYYRTFEKQMGIKLSSYRKKIKKT